MTVIIDTWIKGDPMPAPRPRFDSRSGRAYHPTAYTRELEALAWVLTSQRKDQARKGAPVTVDVEFHRATRLQVDVDNLQKTLLDAAKGVLWHDDHQVDLLRVRKIIGVGAQHAGTRLIVTSP